MWSAILRDCGSVEVERARILRRRAAGVRLSQLMLFLLRQAVVLMPFALNFLALLWRQILDLLVALARLGALLRSEARPLFHLGLHARLLLRSHFRVAPRDIQPFPAAWPFNAGPFSLQWGQDLLLIGSEL